MEYDVSRRGRPSPHSTPHRPRSRSCSNCRDHLRYIAHLEGELQEAEHKLSEANSQIRVNRGTTRENELLKSEIESWERQGEEWELEREKLRKRIKVLEGEKKKDREVMLKEFKEMAGPTPAATPSPLPSAWGEVEELRRRWTQGSPTPTPGGMRRGGMSPPKSLSEEPISPSRSPTREPVRPRWSSHSHTSSISSYDRVPSFTHSRTPSTTSVQTPHTHTHGRQRSNSAISSRSFYPPSISSPLSSPKPANTKQMRRFAPGETPQPLFLPAASVLHSSAHSQRNSLASEDIVFESLQNLVSPDGMGVGMNPLGDSLFKELARAENRRLEEESEGLSSPTSPNTSAAHSRAVSGAFDPHKTPTPNNKLAPPTSHPRSPRPKSVNGEDSDEDDDSQLEAEWWSIASIFRATQAYEMLKKLWGETSDPNVSSEARREKRKEALGRLRRISSTMSVNGSVTTGTNGGSSIAPSTPNSIPSFSAYSSPSANSSASQPQTASSATTANTANTTSSLGILSLIQTHIGPEAFSREQQARKQKADAEHWVLLLRFLVVVVVFVGMMFKGEGIFDGWDKGRLEGGIKEDVVGHRRRRSLIQKHGRTKSRILPAEEVPSPEVSPVERTPVRRGILGRRR